MQCFILPFFQGTQKWHSGVGTTARILQGPHKDLWSSGDFSNRGVPLIQEAGSRDFTHFPFPITAYRLAWLLFQTDSKNKLSQSEIAARSGERLRRSMAVRASHWGIMGFNLRSSAPPVYPPKHPVRKLGWETTTGSKLPSKLHAKQGFNIPMTTLTSPQYWWQVVLYARSSRFDKGFKQIFQSP